MEKIRKYVDRFFKKNRMNDYYDLNTTDWHSLAIMATGSMENAVDVTGTVFNYGHAKGYRAAVAEMKKGGVA